MACCGKARAKAKKIAIRKATINANKLAKAGKLAKPKKKNVKAHVPHATKTKPCTLCGKPKIPKAKV